MKTNIIKWLETFSVVLLILTSDCRLSPLLDQLVKLASYPTVALLIIRQPLGRVAYVATRDWSLIILCVFACSSIFWSENTEETATQLKSLFRTTLLGTYLAVRYSPKEQMRLLIWVIGIAAILSLVFSVAVPSYGTAISNNVFVWQGIYAHKQYLARAMTVGCMVFLLALLSTRKYWWLKLAMLFIMLLLLWQSTSKTGIGFLLVCIYIMPLYKIAKQKFRIRETILAVAFMINGTVAMLLLGNLETIVVDIMGKDLEFNGRLPLWQKAIEVGCNQPWFGYGYAGFWSSPISLEVAKSLWIRQELNANHSHNGFIDIFLQLGVVGLILLAFNFSIVIFNVIYLLFISKTIECFWMFNMIFLMLCFNIFELNTLLTANFLWIYYISISLSLVLELEQIKHGNLKQ
ncbi:O-antigen ligase family protein [aff. Roholtiella sp. LEGE 12411]|uniref:O-antigen ligase family protein n=1 Tax=aff. Roholtiella sp. LEGE 12411 TaxID=1828822 RepID=UPI0018803277|nr:O-antigen ligase [aff. Roholtiella sp. LEGE 12411]MBE9037032.1 O-antigen ligase family protein [aff. Roholtiella sp. LEGE 12411]